MERKMVQDELDELIVSEEKILDKKLIADILKEYVKITDKGEIIFESKYSKLNAKAKILVFLLARKVMSTKNIGNLKSEGAGPKEISEKTGLPYGKG
jgi:hypothetical protein